ncbi:hypothetical protein [Streptomyces sp. NRRL F-2580]|uniref:hypothetical protein n=1 Tax=Streptomyces sp. NRRL F-2580 TaxID=1463841 RepID=UPI0004C6A01B|nr:hypothetical protein [Streptomyces sp. NRRL F-2580]
MADTQWRPFERAAEHGSYERPARRRVRADFEALHAVLDTTQSVSTLPEHASAYEALDAFVVRRRTLCD